MSHSWRHDAERQRDIAAVAEKIVPQVAIFSRDARLFLKRFHRTSISIVWCCKWYALGAQWSGKDVSKYRDRDSHWNTLGNWEMTPYIQYSEPPLVLCYNHNPCYDRSLWKHAALKVRSFSTWCFGSEWAINIIHLTDTQITSRFNIQSSLDWNAIELYLLRSF